MHKIFTLESLKLLLGMCFIASSIGVYGQTTTSHSPYSQFGLGQMREDLLSQSRAMGGISTGLRYQSGLATFNPANPASYSAFNSTILEAGLYGNITQLGKGTATNNTADFAFSHIAIGVPLGKKVGGMALGLMPFSDVGYNSSQNITLENIQYKKTFSGEGGLNKAFVGYGISPVKGFSVGANAGLLFGNLSDISSISFPYSFGAYDVRQEESRLIRGLILDYGAQYSTSLGNKMNLTLGYSGTLNNVVSNTTTITRSRTESSLDPDFQNVALDTVGFRQYPNRDINLPLKHNVGFTLSKGYNWMVGADFKYADWTYFQTRTGEPRLGKSYGVAIGGQFKPDVSSFRYWNLVDYRLGFRYNNTPVRFNNRDINDMAITVGAGLPLPETNFGNTFSRINISAEFGQQGTLSDNLVRERYININLGFTINDLWFRRRSLD